MCAAAKLLAVIRDRDDAHQLLILLAKKRDGPGLQRLVLRHQIDGQLVVADHVFVQEPLDILHLLDRYLLKMRKIKTEAVRLDERTRLPDVGAQDLTQDGLQDMRRGVRPADGLAPLGVDFRRDRVAHGEPRPLLQPRLVNDRLVLLLRRAHPSHDLAGLVLEAPRVTDLTALFGVKRGLLQDHGKGFVLRGVWGLLAVCRKLNDTRLLDQGLVADKGRRLKDGAAARKNIAVHLARAARALLLPFNKPLDGLPVHG